MNRWPEREGKNRTQSRHELVLACNDGRSFTVEFTTDDGTTAALAKVAADQIHSLARNEIHHARPFALAAH